MTVEKLEQITMVQGSTKHLCFEVAEDDVIVDITPYQAWFALSQYGFEDENVFAKEMTATADNLFTIDLLSSETASLPEGAYTAKIILKKGDNFYKDTRMSFNLLKDTNARIG